ncbi:TENM4 [Acrasis kona]|uniref:TENM4 n=1 Tax=Acrasis kona TaxID=1008807 RepID=A0AAW2YKC8_9EUKA
MRSFWVALLLLVAMIQLVKGNCCCCCGDAYQRMEMAMAHRQRNIQANPGAYNVWTRFYEVDGYAKLENKNSVIRGKVEQKL